jgi:hypothetical protein
MRIYIIGNGASTAEVIQFGRGQTPAAAQTWRDLERYWRLFPRALVVKGILNPADAVRALEIGVDGIIVSNHGGRQLDQAPASLEALPAIKGAVGDKLTVMLDSGVRRGADILIAALASTIVNRMEQLGYDDEDAFGGLVQLVEWGLIEPESLLIDQLQPSDAVQVHASGFIHQRYLLRRLE